MLTTVAQSFFLLAFYIIKSVALQLRRAKTDWSGCCQMAVQGALWLAKRLSLNLNFSFLNRISLLLNQVATQLFSRGWVDPIPDPILPEKFLGYSRESNLGPLGWPSDVLTTIPNRPIVQLLIMEEERWHDCSCTPIIPPLLWGLLYSSAGTLYFLVPSFISKCLLRINWISQFSKLFMAVHVAFHMVTFLICRMYIQTPFVLHCLTWPYY